MQRVSKSELQAIVERLQSDGVDIAIHWAYGRPRCTTRQEGRDLSPRLPTGQMWLWLHGFEAGRSSR